VVDLPYTYTDEGGDQIRVHHSYITVVHSDVAGVALLPDAEVDRAELARAVLGEHSEYAVFSKRDVDDDEEAAAGSAAESMRDRAVAAVQGFDLCDCDHTPAIRALPLLPDGDTAEAQDDPTPALCGTPCPRGHDHSCARSPKHCGPHRDVKQKGDESCSWLEGESVTTVHAATTEEPCPATIVVEGIDIPCGHSAGHGHAGRHYVYVAGHATSWWGNEGPASEANPSVHVSTPEGVTPCGQGTRDVTVTPLIPDATCVECLRAVAIEKGERIVELRRELHARGEDAPARRVRTWDTRPTADVLASMDRFAEGLARLVEPAAAPAHDPTVCTDIGCLACRVAQLELDMKRQESRVGLLEVAQGRVDRLHDRLDALELAAREAAQSGGAPHVEVAGGSTPEPCPSTAWNSSCVIDMVCAYDRSHDGPHYNPASGGWEWDATGHVTALDGRTPTHHIQDGV